MNMKTSKVYFSRVPSPIGALLLLSDGVAITGIYMESHKHGPDFDPAWIESEAPFAAARRQLDEYFAGEREQFDVPIAPRGTAFQEAVWRALVKIPYGTTMTYLELARSIGRPAAVRAVGAANGRNPISIIVPCHRVVGADGSLVGYAGGIERKLRLLDLERASAARAIKSRGPSRLGGSAAAPPRTAPAPAGSR